MFKPIKTISKIIRIIKNTFKKLKNIFKKIIRKIIHSKILKIITVVFACLFLLLVIFTVYVVSTSKKIYTEYQSIEFEDLPKSFDGFKLCVISDIHIGLYIKQRDIENMVGIIEKEKPDIVFVVGDHIYSLPRKFKYHDKKNAQMLEELFRTLSRNFTVYAVRGNHDNWEAKDAIMEATINGGAFPLDNDGTWLTNKINKDERIRISGVGDLYTDTVDIDIAIGDAVTDDFTIVLSHNPEVIDQILAKDKDKYVDLMLSGHTHAGQINIVNKKTDISKTPFGDMHYYGLKEYRKTKLFITSGVGMVLLPIRYNAEAEVVFITLKTKLDGTNVIGEK